MQDLKTASDGSSSAGSDAVIGVVLAGGRARRFDGGSKWAAMLAGERLIDRVIARAKPQVRALAVNMPEEAAVPALGAPVLSDQIPNCGPLGGLHAGLRWALEAHDEARFLATFPCDAPFLPGDLVRRLYAAACDENAEVAAPVCEGRVQTTLALWSTSLFDMLEEDLKNGVRRATEWALEKRHVLVRFDDSASFVNINTHADLQTAEALLSQTSS